MAGFLRKRGEGWQLIVSGGFDPASGRRIQHTKTVQGTKREATAALAELVVQCNQGALVNTRANVSDLLDAWLDRARQDLSPSTVRTTQFFTELYLRPMLGKVSLRKLGPLDIRPPDPEEVGRLLTSAWAEDPDFAMFLRLGGGHRGPVRGAVRAALAVGGLRAGGRC